MKEQVPVAQAPPAHTVPTPAPAGPFEDALRLHECSVASGSVAAPLPVEDQWPSPPTRRAPIAPTEEQLRQEPWYHGQMSRRAAEKLLRADGDFLVRDSVTNPGQYVLTGMHGGQPKHLLLVDPEGVVRWALGAGWGQVLRVRGKECRDRPAGAWCGAGLEAACGRGGEGTYRGVASAGRAGPLSSVQDPGHPHSKHPLGLIKHFSDYRALYIYRSCFPLLHTSKLQSIFQF